MTQPKLIQHLELWSAATRRKSTSGRGSNRKIELAGIKKLRDLILELAVRGKLVPQNPDDEPASELLKRIEAEKAQLVAEGKIKKPKKLKPITEDEKLFALPKGWEWTRFNDVIDVRDGTHDSPKESKGENTYPLITSKNFTNGKIDFSSAKRISEKDYNEISKRSAVNIDDILFSMIGGNIGNQVIVIDDIKFSIKNVALFTYYKKDYTYPKYVYIYSQYLAQKLQKLASGGAQPFVSLSFLRSILFALPPIAEQHRIVAKVDKLMALCDQLEQDSDNQLAAHQQLVETLLATLTNAADAEELAENWQRLSAHFNLLFSGPMGEWAVDRLKETLLQLAVMGKLVPQNPDDEPASELLKRIEAEKAQLIAEGKIKKPKKLKPITEDEKLFALPEGWEWIRLGTIGDWGAGATPTRSNSSYYGGNIPWFKSGELSKDYISSSEEHITPEALSHCSLRLNKPGDVLIAMYGATIGKASIINIESTTNQAVCACTPFPSITNNYLLNLLKSLKPYFISMGAGGAQPNISREKIISTIVALPPLAEQRRIVAKVDELMALCDQLKAHLQTAADTRLQLTDALVAEALS